MKKLIVLLALTLQIPVFAQDSPTTKPATPAPVTTYSACVGQKLVVEALAPDEKGKLSPVVNIATITSLTEVSAKLSIELFLGKEKISTVLQDWVSEPNFIKTQKIDKLPGVKIEKNVYTVSNVRIACTVVTVTHRPGHTREIWIATKGDATAFPGVLWVKDINNTVITNFVKLMKIENPVPKKK